MKLCCTYAWYLTYCNVCCFLRMWFCVCSYSLPVLRFITAVHVHWACHDHQAHTLLNLLLTSHGEKNDTFKKARSRWDWWWYMYIVSHTNRLSRSTHLELRMYMYRTKIKLQLVVQVCFNVSWNRAKATTHNQFSARIPYQSNRPIIIVYKLSTSTHTPISSYRSIFLAEISTVSCLSLEQYQFCTCQTCARREARILL